MHTYINTKLFIEAESMKKFFLALMALPLVAALTACHDDDDMPQVNLKVQYNSPVVDGEVYVVKPNDFKIESVDVTAVREGHKATNGPVSYFINAIPVGTNPVSPYGITIPTADLEIGKFVVQMVMPIYEVDCTMATAVSQITVNVVENESDIPETAVPSNGQTLEYTFQ